MCSYRANDGTSLVLRQEANNSGVKSVTSGLLSIHYSHPSQSLPALTHMVVLDKDAVFSGLPAAVAFTKATFK